MSRLPTRKRELHGLSDTPEYGVWAAMIGRCHRVNDPHHADYGGRGIQVCEQWRESFVAFIADMGPRPSPDHTVKREDNNGNYEPSNCRWATLSEQMRNKRTNHWLTHNGETLTITDWATRLGIDLATLQDRLKRHPPEIALAHGGGAMPRNRPNAVLTDELVRQLRADYVAGNGYRKLAKKYGVARAVVKCIVKRKTYQHVE